MRVVLVIIFFVLSLIMLSWGGNLLVDSAINIGKITGVSQVVIGSTLVSIITTLPELLVTVFSTNSDLQNIAVGNAIGSMMFNFLIIIGLLLIAKPMLLKLKLFRSKIVVYAVMLVSLVVFALDGQINYLEGALLFFVFVVFYFQNYKESKKVSSKYVFEKKTVHKKIVFDTIVLFVLGGVLISFGANFLVKSACMLGDVLKINNKIIGFTCVAIGTSVPELMTAITSIRKNCMALSVGNVIGANILNGSLLLAVAVLAGGKLLLDKAFAIACFLVLILTLLLLFIPSFRNKKTTRLQGVIFVLCYVGYIILLVMK